MAGPGKAPTSMPPLQHCSTAVLLRYVLEYCTVLSTSHEPQAPITVYTAIRGCCYVHLRTARRERPVRVSVQIGGRLRDLTEY